MSKPTLVYQSSILSRSGYGDRSRDLAYSLIELYDSDYQIIFVPTKWGETPWDAISEESDPEIFSRITWDLQPFQPWPFRPNVFIQVSVPNEFQPYGEISIGVTAGIETDTCTPEFIYGCNRMDLTLVSSTHSKEVLTSPQRLPSGQTISVHKPVETLFEGINLSVFDRSLVNKQSDLYKKLSTEVKEDFAFLFVGHWMKGDLGQDRKDIGMLIKVFGETFRGEKNTPALILKTSSATFSLLDRDRILERVTSIKENFGIQNVPVYVVHGALSPSEMNDLYNHPKVKAHVSFSHGEGFNRTLLEATTSGKPVIYTDFSGPKDFMNPEYSFPLPYNLTPVHPSAADDKFLLHNAKWATVKYPSASTLMMVIYKNYDQIVAKARKHIKYTRENYSMSKMTEKVKELLTPHLKSIPMLKPIKIPKLKPIQKKDLDVNG